MVERRPKNDVAWEELFERHRIMAGIARHGFFRISASQINLVREARLMDTYSVVGRTVLGILERFAQPATRQSGQGDAESLRSDIAELRTQVEALAQRIDTCISRVDKVTLELYRRLEEPTLPSAATKPEPVQWYTPPKGRVSTKVKERTERVRHAIRELKDAGREFTQVELAKQAGLEYHQLRWILAQNPNLMDP